MPRQEKVREVTELTEKVNRATAMYFLDFTSVKANDFNMVRRRLREAGATVRVAKNRLALRALKESGIGEAVVEFLRGPTSLVLATGDPIAPARVLRELAKKLESLRVKGAYFERVLYPTDKFEFLAGLATKDELRGQVVGALSAPIWELALGLEWLLAELVFVTEELAKRPAEPAAG